MIDPDKNLSITNPFLRTQEPSTGSVTWSKDGKWLKEGDSKKFRLRIGKSPQTYIAIQDATGRNFFQRIKDYITHINIKAKQADGSIETVSVNIGSLSKRTQLSVVKIILKKLTGQLTLDYIQKKALKAQERIDVYDAIVANGRARASALGQDPELKEQQLRNLLHTSMKCKHLSKGIFYTIEKSVYIVQKDKKGPLRLMERTVKLGSGASGIVYEAFDLATKQSKAVKFATSEDYKESIENEYRILREIHSEGHVEGIQDAPHCVIDLQHPDLQFGYITEKYVSTLSDAIFLKTPMMEKLLGSRSLFRGLSYLHSKDFIHGDIKSENCCIQNGEFQLADFGSANRIDKIIPDNPLTFTRSFTSDADLREQYVITMNWRLHLMASGKIDEILQAVYLNTILTYIDPNDIKFDAEAARLYIANIILKYGSVEGFEKLDLPAAPFQKEIQQLKQNPKLLKEKRLNLSPFKLNKVQQAKLHERARALCKPHDVYGLGKTLLCQLRGRQMIDNASNQAELAKLSKDSDLAAVNPELTQLLTAMLDPDPTKRPTAQEAMLQYDQILQKIDKKAPQ